MRALSIRLAAALLAASAARGEERERVVLVQSEAGVVSLLDPATGIRRATVRVGKDPRGVAVSPDGRVAVVADSGLSRGGSALSVVNLAFARLSRTIPLSYLPRTAGESVEPKLYVRAESVAFGEDSRHVWVTCPREDVILVVDIFEGVVEAEIETGRQPEFILPSPDGTRAYVSHVGSGTVVILDTRWRGIVDRFEAGSGAAGLALHPDGKEIWVANSGSNSISVVDLETFQELAEFACGAAPVRLAFAPDGRHVACANMAGSSVTIFTTDDYRVERVIELDPPAPKGSTQLVRLVGEDLGADSSLTRGCRPLDVLLVPRGDKLFVSCSRTSHLAEIDTRRWTLARYHPTGAGPRGLAWWRTEDDWVSAK